MSPPSLASTLEQTGLTPLPEPLLQAFAIPVGEFSSPPFIPLMRHSLPPADLAGLVLGLGHYVLDPDVLAAYRCYRLPEGRGGLMFLRRRRAPAWTKLVLVGPRDQYAIDPIQGVETNSFAMLEPGAMGWLAGIPALQVRNRIIPLEDVWGDAGRRLHAQLATLPDDELCAALSAALIARPRGSWSPDCRDLVKFMERHAGTITVERLAAHSGYSTRHLLRMFDQQVGLSPKLLLRIVRMRAVIAALRITAQPDWTHAAMIAGYSDQSHLIADCVRFTGMTPTQIAANRNLGMILTHEALLMPVAAT